MTERWTESNKLLRFKQPYKQPQFHDTPHEENADNVRYALHHISKPCLLKRYELPLGYSSTTGRPDRGIATEYRIWMEIQPYQSNGEDSKLEEEGESIEGMYEFWIDPFHPKHIETHNQPIYLRQSDSRFITGDGFNADVSSGHTDLIYWYGEHYAIRRLENWQSGSHEDENGQYTGYQWGLLHLWRDHYHERERNIDNDQFAYP